MANCHDIFFEYNKVIRLSKKRKDSLITSRDALREKIKKDFKAGDTDYKPKFYSQGSFEMDTIINPYQSCNYDMDDGTYFEVTEVPSESPETFHQWIYDAVEGHTDKTIDKDPCVRVIFADGHNVDLTIYYKIGSNHPHLAFKGKGWIESDPQEFIRWFNDKLDEGKQLRRIVRYLKAWSDYKKGNMPIGLILTILAAENFVKDSRDDLSFLNTLKDIQNKLKYSFICYRPTTPVYEDLFSNYSQADREYFLNALDSLIKSGDQAINEPNQKDACDKWKKHFGDRFPCSLAEDKLDDAYTHKAPAFIKSDGRSA